MKQNIFAFLLVGTILVGAYKTFIIPSNPTVGQVATELYQINVDSHK